ncbi:UvrD-helicase domain-containing protein [Pseudomonas syringae]
MIVNDQRYSIVIDERLPPLINKGLLWSEVILPGITLNGLPKAQASSLQAAINDVLGQQRERQTVEHFNQAYALVSQWLTGVARQLQGIACARHWITHEQQQALLDSRPRLPLSDEALWALFREPSVQAHCTAGGRLETVEQDLNDWQADWPATWQALNEQHTRQELTACKYLFDHVEKKPLTEEQARAVICFDNRVQVVAAAGSGKTSTMVAKAAYAIDRGLMLPGQIVLLAFNKQAADELKRRAAQSFKRLGMDDTQVQASTFHALGLHIIGQATGRKPDIPTWAVDAQGGLRKLTELIEQLKSRSLVFRVKWDMFRLVFGRPLADFGDEAPADAWNASGQGLITTLNGERVRSQEECMIANWLFYNGVEYAYERNYVIDTASAEHRQYKPDFYYPAIDLYHEHLALDADGQPPPHFEGYLEGVTWKRQLHQTHGTDLIETTSWQLRNQDWMADLSQALTQRGIELKPDPERPTPANGQPPMQSTELVVLLRTFISHAKSNGLDAQAMAERLDELPGRFFKLRYRLFLQLVEPVLQAWDQALAAERSIDFEDMLNLAAEHLEQERYDCGFTLVLADEFQDASRARARLCRALVQKPGRHLFAVGDDWQSINRFAGADVSVMTGFAEWFGHGQVLKLERTFRCPQALCDITSGFVSKNPAQLDKHVRSATPAYGPVLQGLQVKHREELGSAIDGFLHQLYQDLGAANGVNGKVSVVILGRYNADQAYVPQHWQARYGQRIELSFMTIHRAKGSEADYVILPAMISHARRLSFPNMRSEDPVLSMAMPGADDFPQGEERRLFYVALTRARRSVALFTVQGMRSVFVQELVRDQVLTITDIEGQAIDDISCPACGQGAIVTRTGRYGDFKACSNYPACEYKPAKNRSGGGDLIGPPGGLVPAR